MRKNAIELYRKKLMKPVQAVLSLVDELNQKNISTHAAATAYFGTLAFFPFIVVVLALGSLAVNPAELTQTVAYLSQVLPDDIAALITTQLANAQHHHANSIVVAIIAFVLAMLGASGVVSSIMQGLNSIYEVRETRSFIRQKVTSLLLTIGAVIAVVAVVCIFVFSEAIARFLHVPEALQTLFDYSRWALVFGVTILWAGILYRFGPNRKNLRIWHFFTTGSLLAIVIWALTSAVFFWYLQNIANLTRSYSLYAGIIGMMLWLNVSSYTLLLGADIDFRRNRSTAR